MRKKERDGAGLINVGAPTMLIEVVVNAGFRKTGLQFTVDRSQFGAEFSSRLKSPELE
jgi:hypothetical protein